MAKNMNKKPFDEATQLKLEIFGECFREWLPVFIHNPLVDKIFIYDFFAGSGTDINGLPGSPIKLLNEARGEDCKMCKSLNGKEIVFAFNEFLEDKHLELTNSVKDHIQNCIKDNCKSENCHYKTHFGQFEFKEAFIRENVQSVLKNERYAKFIILDQYGFKEVDDNIFKKLISFPKTDFIFFIASSFIDRFKEHPNTLKHINTSDIKFEDYKPKERHRAIAQHFRNLINIKEYYLHHFTIKKGANNYGLIFGSRHTLGMEKFLKVCWSKDPKSGESNGNIDNDYEVGTLFFEESSSNKKERVKLNIRNKILDGTLRNNISGLKFAMAESCLPIVFTEVVKELEHKGLIKRHGDLKYSSTSIHRCKEYTIELLKK